MSNSESFIAEVAEEVRKDRMMSYVRRYGWIVGLALVGIVGGAAYWEYQKASRASAAQALGGEFLEALQSGSPGSRAAKLSEVDALGDGAVLRDLLAAGEQSLEDSRSAGEALQALIDDPETRPIYRDMARLRLAMTPETTLMSDQRLELLEPLLVAGAPFRLTALEVRALIHAERRDREAALADLTSLLSDAALGAEQRQRALQLMVALGGDMEAL